LAERAFDNVCCCALRRLAGGEQVGAAVLPVIHLPLIRQPIASYPLVLTAYLLLALALVGYLNWKQGINLGTTVRVFALGVPAGIIGARLLDMCEQARHYVALRDVVGRHGSSIYGALLADIIVTVLYVYLRGGSPLRFLDAGAPVMALGESLTRIGCFLNGCCYGIAWNGPLSVIFPPESFAFQDQNVRGLLSASAAHSLPVHPVQLYSAALMLLAFAYLLRCFFHEHRTGDVFWNFLILYGGLRLLVAPLRIEALASMKFFSFAFVALGAAALFRRPPITRATRPRSKDVPA
jgi:phosphatidylglycerol:prolipoprotein diacylglycerol transferase